MTNQKAKRQKASRKDDPELPYQYAGQVFCEMLGQTCHKEFYDNIQESIRRFFSKTIAPQADFYRLSSFMVVIPPSQYTTPNFHILISEKLPSAEGIISIVRQ